MENPGTARYEVDGASPHWRVRLLPWPDDSGQPFSASPASEPFPGPRFQPRKVGPAHSGRGRSRRSGARRRGPFKEQRCGNPSPQSGQRLRQLHLRTAPAPAPPSISRAVVAGASLRAGPDSRRLEPGRAHQSGSRRGTGDVVCRAGGGRPGLRRPGSGARGVVAPAGASGSAASRPAGRSGGVPVRRPGSLRVSFSVRAVWVLRGLGCRGGRFGHQGKPCGRLAHRRIKWVSALLQSPCSYPNYKTRSCCSQGFCLQRYDCTRAGWLS